MSNEFLFLIYGPQKGSETCQTTSLENTRILIRVRKLLSRNVLKDSIILIFYPLFSSISKVPIKRI